MSSRPSLSLSSPPSLSANPTISMSPSITVTETPTASMEPSHSPTCEALNTGGNYTIAGDGNGNGGGGGGGAVETVDMGYTYELMTSASASSASISSTVMMEEVIPALELAMVKFLIPGYFASICGDDDGGGTSGIRRMDESGSGTRLEDMDGMVGMSTSPVDVPLLSGECKRKLRYTSTRYIYC